jgi:glutamate decarboxylase
MIDAQVDFELITDPELNILNYRYVPMQVQEKLKMASHEDQKVINEILDRSNKRIQKQQRAAGKTFVSRTRFSQRKYGGEAVSVFRVVMANPMTTLETLRAILDEQLELAKRKGTAEILAEINAL